MAGSACRLALSRSSPSLMAAILRLAISDQTRKTPSSSRSPCSSSLQDGVRRLATRPSKQRSCQTFASKTRGRELVASQQRWRNRRDGHATDGHGKIRMVDFQRTFSFKEDVLPKIIGQRDTYVKDAGAKKEGMPSFGPPLSRDICVTPLTAETYFLPMV